MNARHRLFALTALFSFALAVMGADGKDAGCGPGPNEVVETCTPTSLSKHATTSARGPSAAATVAR